MGGLVGWSFTMQATRGKHALPERRRKPVLHLPISHRQPRVAVLVDAENVPVESLRCAMSVARRSGRVTVKRAYGNAALLQSGAWKGALASSGIEPVACFGYVAGKNSSDIRLVVEAMELLLNQKIDVFVIVSGDSDFIPLAREIRAGGRVVHGVGSAPVSEAYKGAFDEFHLVCSAKSGQRGRKRKKGKAGTANQGDNAKVVDERMVRLTRACMDRLSPGGGWCDIGRLCNQLSKQLHGFSPKEYGCKNMTAFARETGILEVKKTDCGKRVRLIAA